MMLSEVATFLGEEYTAEKIAAYFSIDLAPDP